MDRDILNFRLTPEALAAESLTRLVRIDANLTALLLLESTILAHILKDDPQKILDYYTEMADQFYEKRMTEIWERHKQRDEPR